MSNIRYVLWDVETRKQVANYIVERPLPLGTVVNLPMLSTPENTMLQVFAAGIWQIVSPPEVAFIPRLSTVVQKVWVREVGKPGDMSGKDDDQSRYDWMTTWEEQTPPFLDPPDEPLV